MILAVTITHNSMKGNILEPFLRCFANQEGCEARLLIIDNASTDGTVEWLGEIANPEVTSILNSENVGFSAACNQAIEVARRWNADQILLINHDTEFGTTLFRDLLASLRQSGASAISPAIAYHNAPDRIWYAGGSFRLLRGMTSHHDGIGRKLTLVEPALAETDFAPACCLLVDMDMFSRVGPFDERFFVYWEDADLCWRMKRIGERLMIDHQLTLLHKVSVTTGGPRSDFSLRMYNKNHMIFLRKHFGMGMMMIVLPILAAKAGVNLFLRRLSLRQIGIQFRALAEGIVDTLTNR